MQGHVDTITEPFEVIKDFNTVPIPTVVKKQIKQLK